LAGETVSNVLAVVSDAKLPEARVLSFTDYYAFGGAMPGRSGGAGYRYGFNGKENDAETGWQDYGMRMYNPRLARFFTVDPIAASYPMLTPYQFASNRPIDGIDLDGLEYLSAEEALIEVRNGIVMVKVANFNSFTRGKHHMANQKPSNWRTGEVGIHTSLGTLALDGGQPNIFEKYASAKAEADALMAKVKPGPVAPQSNLDGSTGAPDVHFWHGLMHWTLKGKIVKKDGTPDMRYKNNETKIPIQVAYTTNGARAGAGAALLINGLNASAELYEQLAWAKDRSLIWQQYWNELQFALISLKAALDTPGMVPDEFRNSRDLGDILNIVLSGQENDPDNYKKNAVGWRIINEISGNNRNKIPKTDWSPGTASQSQQDATRVAGPSTRSPNGN
jgi:RHS repeat-associated protein